MLLSLGCCCLSAGLLQAQEETFRIDWFSIDGGGGTSTGGVYRLSGTIGQPDAGVLSDTEGRYTLVGGFWGVVAAIQTPGAPFLSISRNTVGLQTTVTVSWPIQGSTDYVLQRTSNLNLVPDAWQTVGLPYQTNQTDIFITVPLPAENTFYRLMKPQP